MSAVALVAADTRLPEPRARPDVAPVAVYLLTHLPAHGGLEAGEVVAWLFLLTVRDGKTGIVEGVSTLGVAVRPTYPAFYCAPCITILWTISKLS